MAASSCSVLAVSSLHVTVSELFNFICRPRLAATLLQNERRRWRRAAPRFKPADPEVGSVFACHKCILKICPSV